MGARGAGHSPKIVSVLSAQRPDESSTKVLPLAGRVVVPTYTEPMISGATGYVYVRYLPSAVLR